MKQLYKICLGSLSAFLFLLLFTNASTGPGQNFSTGYTGAPFDGGQYCSSCHSGGNFTPLVTIQLRNLSNQPVTNYVPGNSYNVVVNVSSSTGVTPNTRYGFMIVAVNTPGNTNAGTWGSFSPDYHSVVINGRTYVEHDDRLTSGAITLPWTAPTGQSNVTFYAAGNVVNFSMDPTGDNPNIANLTVPAVALPVTWLFFKGNNLKDQVVLEWATTREIDNGHFLLEKSSDGEKFAPLATIEASESPAAKQEYSYTDMTPGKDNYYRISQVDVNGMQNIYQTIRVQSEERSSGLAYVKGNHVMVLISQVDAAQAVASIHSIDGRKVMSVPVNLSAGSNTLSLDKPAAKGIYLISVTKGGESIYSDKILVE